eukprot:1159081-Pelagomonas_calceolata.AAC.13
MACPRPGSLVLCLASCTVGHVPYDPHGRLSKIGPTILAASVCCSNWWMAQDRANKHHHHGCQRAWQPTIIVACLHAYGTWVARSPQCSYRWGGVLLQGLVRANSVHMAHGGWRGQNPQCSKTGKAFCCGGR